MVLPLGGWFGLILRNQLTESKKLLRNKRERWDQVFRIIYVPLIGYYTLFLWMVIFSSTIVNKLAIINPLSYDPPLKLKPLIP